MYVFTIRDVLWLTALVAMGLAWWMDRRHLASELAARQLADKLAATQPRHGVGIPREELPNQVATTSEFIQALREINDWYEFADRTADPFAKTAIADDAIPTLIQLLADSDTEVRTRAACTLGKIHRNPSRVVPALIPLLDDVGPNVQWHAAFALGQFRSEAKAAVPALQRQIANDQSAIAAFSADMVRQIDPTIDVEPGLIRQLGSTSNENRARAVQALSVIGTQRAKVALVDAFARETNTKLRDQMASAISSIDARLSASEREK